MPWFQVAGIVIAGVIALIGVPKLIAETTAPWRLTHRMMSRAAAAEAAPAPGAKAVLLDEAKRLSLQLAAVRTIRFSARDKVATAIGVLGSLLAYALTAVLIGPENIAMATPPFPPVVAQLMDDDAVPDVQGPLLNILGVTLLLVLLPLPPRAMARLAVVRLQRQLFIDLAAPASSIRRLAIPSAIDYMIRPTLTSERVHARAKQLEHEGNVSRHRHAEIDPEVHLVNVAIAQLESEDYRHRPQKK